MTKDFENEIDINNIDSLKKELENDKIKYPRFLKNYDKTIKKVDKEIFEKLKKKKKKEKKNLS